MKLSRADIEREVRYTQRFLSTDEFVPSESPEKIDAACDDLIRDFELMANAARPLEPSQQGIVTLTRRKTAALLADRVWAADTDVDLSIAFGWDLPMEVRLRAALKLHQMFERAPTAPHTGPAAPHEVEAFVADVERDLALGFHGATGATVVPLYSSSSRRDSQYRSGDQAALVCIVQNLKIVDEDQLTWTQVAEFRRDEEARAAYRRFIHWLDRDLIDKPIQYVSDEIGQRLERYEWSLLTAGGLLLGHAALSVATALVERRDIQMAHREIAYVQQLMALKSDNHAPCPRAG